MLNYKIFFSILLLLLSIFIGLGSLEIMLRFIIKKDEWTITKSFNVLRNFKHTYSIENLYYADYENVLYERNNYGLRDNCNNIKDINILTIGGSTTDQKYVDLKYTFQSELGRLISKEVGKKICVSNAGIDGHSSFGHILSFKHWLPLIKDLNPKYILLYIGINDANFEKSINSKDLNYSSGDFKSFVKQLYIVQELLPLYRYLRDGISNEGFKYASHKPKKYFIKDYKIKKISKETPLKAQRNAIIFEKRLIEILKHIYALNSQPICVTQPHLFVKKQNLNYVGLPNIINNYSGLDFDYSLNLINEIMKKYCNDGYIEINKEDFKNLHFYDGTHTTKEGSLLLGKKIFEQMSLQKKLEIFR